MKIIKFISAVILISLFACLNIYNIYAQCPGNLLTNGSFTSSEGENVTAPGWSGSSSPDVNDETGLLHTTPSYNWTGTPLASPDGGTWQNLFGSEYITQTVTVVPGQSYNFSFYYAAQGIANPVPLVYTGPVGVKIFLNGVLAYTAPDDSTQYTWESACFVYTATTTSVIIKIATTQTQYVGVDGACLVVTNSGVDLGNDTALCEGETLILDATTTDASYLWQDNSTNSTYNVIQQGSYWVTVIVDGCSNTDTINIDYISAPTVSLGNDTTLCEGEILTLDVTEPDVSYLWQDNSTNSSYIITQQGEYWVILTNECDTATDTINVSYNSLPSVSIGNDTILCQGETLILDATTTDALYLWQDNSTNSTYNVTQQGDYRVTVTVDRCSNSDTVNVNYVAIPSVFLGNDTTLCQEEILTLDVTEPGVSYLWQDNSTNSSYTITQQGEYWVMLTNECDTAVDTINVSYNPLSDINIGNDTALCQGETLVLDATTTNASYLWQDNSINSTYTLTSQGTYWVEVTVNSCSRADTISITYYPIPSVDIGSDTIFCEGEMLTLYATVPGASYLWQDNSVGSTFNTTQAGTYWVKVTADGCSSTDTIVCELKDCNCFIYVPNAFTPDGNTLNDKFMPVFDCDFTGYDIMIFSRWGQVIFETTDIYEGWNGKYGNLNLPEGMYCYILNYTLSDGTQKQVIGRVNLIR